MVNSPPRIGTIASSGRRTTVALPVARLDGDGGRSRLPGAPARGGGERQKERETHDPRIHCGGR